MFCKYCGTKLNDDVPTNAVPGGEGEAEMRVDKKPEKHVYCPYCLGEKLMYGEAGFSGGKALVGSVLAGPIGVLAGTLGKNDLQISCMECGSRFEVKESLVTTPEAKASFESELRKMIKEYGPDSDKVSSMIRWKYPNIPSRMASKYREHHHIIISKKARQKEINAEKNVKIGCFVIFAIIYCLAMCSH